MADTETTEPKTVIKALMQLNGQFGGDGTIMNSECYEHEVVSTLEGE